jgi:hypothetical protein
MVRVIDRCMLWGSHRSNFPLPAMATNFPEGEIAADRMRPFSELD